MDTPLSASLAISMVAIAAVLALLITMAVESKAAAVGLIQPPNARSSHTTPTPRGGGLAIAVVGLVVTMALASAGASSLWQMAPVLLAMAVLGFTDDLRSLPALLRLAIQLVGFSLIVWLVGERAPIPLVYGLELGGILLGVCVLIVGVWWLNLFNFMDGIDGIAASQAILILAGSAALWLLADATALNDPLWWWPLALVGATSGFLIRNWPPARIFMGDAGSYFLATAIFVVALLTIQRGGLSYPCWLILVTVFVSDASVTLLRRIMRGERPFDAHNRHAYQILSRRFSSHFKATALFAALTMFWAFPLALAAQIHPQFQWQIALLAYVTMVIFMRISGSGNPVAQ